MKTLKRFSKATLLATGFAAAIGAAAGIATAAEEVVMAVPTFLTGAGAQRRRNHHRSDQQGHLTGTL